MPPTCAAWLELTRPHLPEILVGPRAYAGVRAVARHLPGECLTALEARLAPSADRVDVSARLSEPSEALRMASSLDVQRVRELLLEWSQRRAELAPVSSIWLELDLPGDPVERRAEPLPEPLVCAKLHGGPKVEWVVDVLLPRLHGRPLSPAQRRTLRRCLAEIQPPGRLLYVFSLLPRPGGAVRVELLGLDPPAMAGYLERIGPPGAARRVADLGRLISDGERYHLSFDIAEEIAPRIGVECSFERLPHREPRWRQLFDRLVASGLCAPAKRDAVLAWPGVDSLRTAAARWPEHAVGLGGHCVRCLSHVKLVSLPDRPPEAKAYLLFQHLRRSPAGDPILRR